MLIIVTVPYLVWRLGRTDYWAPLVVVQIVGGIILGPGVLGAAYPAYYETVFKPEVIGSLNSIAWWAVMMFVWIAGIELDLGPERELATLGRNDLVHLRFDRILAQEGAGAQRDDQRITIGRPLVRLDGLDGCGFVDHPRVVEQHVEPADRLDRHERRRDYRTRHRRGDGGDH